MDTPLPPLHDYPLASLIEWIEADGQGGLAATSIINANTRKQHGLLSAPDEQGRRCILVAGLQETVLNGCGSCDLSTNAYFGGIHPMGCASMKSFSADPWPTWQYAFDSAAVEKQVVVVHGEHTVIVIYTLTGTAQPMTLVVRPLLAFRDLHAVRTEQRALPNNWLVCEDVIECRPFAEGPTLYITHPNAKIETVGFWYRGLLYERDHESHLECAEDLFHPGYLTLTLTPDAPCSLIFSTPSPRPSALLENYLNAERRRRAAVRLVPLRKQDPLFETFARSADAFVYERPDGVISIAAGLPWGESERYRGLLAFAGLLLAPERFDTARAYLTGAAGDWRQAGSPSGFAGQTLAGQMHPADVPLWVFIAAWHYWRATRDREFVADALAPLLSEIAQYYLDGGAVRCTDEGLIEVGHEPGADYAAVLPLGTNVLWFNAQQILAELLAGTAAVAPDDPWRQRAFHTRQALAERFICETRAGMADAVRLDPFWRDETLRCSQVLTVGLPYGVVEDPWPVVDLIAQRLATPFGLRTLAPNDARYAGDGSDVMRLPKQWSGSVDATWFGCYCDALKRVGLSGAVPERFAPFEAALYARGYGHLSGAFTGDAPHRPCDYVASASALGEVMRIYGREILGLPHLA